MAVTWSDSYLQQLTDDARKEISKEITAIFHRFSITVTSGLATVSLPDFVREIVEVTYKGDKLIPFSRSEPKFEDQKYRTTEGSPEFYTMSLDGLRTLRFIPVPNENVTADDSGIDGPDLENRVVVSCFRYPGITPTNLPTYMERRIIKAFVCWRAFQGEGKGQNLKGAAYFKSIYDNQISLYKSVKNSYFQARSTTKFIKDRGNPRLARLNDDFTIPTS